MRADQPCRWWAALPGLVIAVLVVGAYLPALPGQFLWDDDRNILESAPLRSLDGLRRIWFEPGATQQYYPLTHTSFWLDFHLWGLHPVPYHVENILLHALGAILVWRILLRLGVRGAWLGAAIFALHAVCVESVAWITQRKNTLCVVFFLASVLASMEFWLPRPAKSDKTGGPSGAKFGAWKWYWLALLLYLCSLWSKTATVGLPGVVLLLAWWKRARLVWRDGVLLLPFLALGLGMGLMTISAEKRQMLMDATAERWRFLPLERSLIATRAMWFYLGKLCWPHPLMFIYPRWRLEAVSLPAYTGVASAAAGLFILWHKRNGWARPVLVVVGYFVALLFPVLGFFNGGFFRYSFVCDHFQYFAAIGPLALAAAGITYGLGPLAKGRPLLRPTVCGALLLALGVLTWRQTAVYQSLETLWRDALTHNPDSWLAHDNLGKYLCQSGHFEEAETHFRKALELLPNDHVAYYNLGLSSTIQGNLDEAAKNFTKALEIFPDYAPAHYNLGNVLTRKSELVEAIREYRKALEIDPGLALAHLNLAGALARSGNVDQAMEEYAQASQWDPELAAAPLSLGNLLTSKGKLDEAVQAYGRALEIQPDNAAAHCGLGRVLASRGKEDDAILHYRKALEIEPNSVDALANLGNALVHQGRLEEAVASYRKALEFDRGSPIIHYNLGVALARQGNPAEAEAELAEAKRLQNLASQRAP